MTAAPDPKTLVHIRWMIRRDLPEVLAIEKAGFDRPRSEEEFLRVLRQRNCIGMVAESVETLVGFMVYELDKQRINVLNLAVHPAFRRMDVGSQMVAKLVGKLSRGRRTELEIPVRESNLNAQLFFRRCGFLAVGTVREHFADNGEDAYLMRYELGGTGK